MPEIRNGDILFIEGRKNIATVERLFSMLKLNRVFDGVIILGKHEFF